METSANLVPSVESQTATADVRSLQRDGRLLLHHVARRADRALGPVPLLDDGASVLQVLTGDPTCIASNPTQFATLTTTVDALSHEAAPATANSIRLTSAYLRSAGEGEELSDEVKVRVRWLRAAIYGLTLLFVVAVLGSIGLLAYVDNGRRAMQQLLGTHVEIRIMEGELAELPPGAWMPARASDAEGRYRPMCPQADGSGLAPADTAEGARADALCSQLGQALLRNQLVMMRLTRWNNLSCGLPLFDPCTVPQGEQKIYEQPLQHHWERTELRTASFISTLTGFVLPLMMGFIGGAAYVLRRLDNKLSENTLEVRDGWHSVLRVLLATMLGGLLGVVWSGDEPVQLGGFALTLAAAAFFVGFALEAVFTVIEAMMEGFAVIVNGVASKLRVLVLVQAPPLVVPVLPGPPSNHDGTETASVVERTLAQFDRRIERLFAQPSLVRFRGQVLVEVMKASGEPPLHLEEAAGFVGGTSGRLLVRFNPDLTPAAASDRAVPPGATKTEGLGGQSSTPRPSGTCSGPFIISDAIRILRGEEKPELLFDVALESDTVVFEPGRSRASCRTRPDTGSEPVTFGFTMPSSGTRHEISVVVSQFNRLIQIVTVPLQTVSRHS
ncbi:hypothetical protein [Falsiroseomonas sp. E2-1-a20]|uniref:hypothetical protein n=1 Tax=Falsiroseomonas sp. E2-1-a20 TaxID=3239300 RepID=UPI003F37A630